MDQGATSNKKRRLVKKFARPIKNKEVGPQINVRSSAELVRKYVNESNKKLEVMLQNAPEIHKRHRHMHKECTQKEGINREETKKRKENKNDREESIQPRKANETRSVTELDASIQEDNDSKQLKKKSGNPTMSIDEFLAKQGIHVEEEGQPIAKTVVEDVRINDHISEHENLEDAHEELGIFECDGDQVMGDSHVEGSTKKRKTRGKTTCKHIHARTDDEREEMRFDKGQAVGPTDKVVNDLTNFLGTLGRNLDFISLTYTNWIAVPNGMKKRLWKYAKSKFIIPKEGKKWVMDGIRDAWNRWKTNIKERHFDMYNNVEVMLKNRPPNIPESQFKKLIAYWSIPYVKAMCSMNSKNRKQQKWRHQMGPINFGRVRVGLHENSETKEEPTQLDVFVATRIGRKGKELDLETQAAIEKAHDHQNIGETAESAYRCFGRTITATFLKRDKEINRIKQEHAKEKESLETQLKEMNEKLQ